MLFPKCPSHLTVAKSVLVGPCCFLTCPSHLTVAKSVLVGPCCFLTCPSHLTVAKSVQVGPCCFQTVLVILQSLKVAPSWSWSSPSGSLPSFITCPSRPLDRPSHPLPYTSLLACRCRLVACPTCVLACLNRLQFLVPSWPPPGL